MNNSLIEIGSFPFSTLLKEEWKNGELHPLWAKQYPDLFDEDDIRLAENQSEYGYHFVEWLSSILLFNATGYRSLISKYEFSNHERKVEVVSRLFPDGLPDMNGHQMNTNRSQYPDLLSYSTDFADWFFCEVKGSEDRLSESQKESFETLSANSGKPVGILRLKKLNDAFNISV